jgi:hypothetical protein
MLSSLNFSEDGNQWAVLFACVVLMGLARMMLDG